MASAFRCWATHFAASGERPLLQLRRGSAVDALLPVQRGARTIAGLRFRLLTSTGNHYWQFGCPIVGADHSAEVVGDVLDALRRRGGWDVLELGPMLARSCQADAVNTHGIRIGMTPGVVRRLEDPTIALSGTWTDYLAGISGSLRRTLKAGEQRLTQKGALTFEECRGGAELACRLDEFFTVEASGWKGREGTAIAKAPVVRAFYTDLARTAAASGALRLYLLRLDGRCIAGEYCVLHGATVHLLKPGYDEAWSKCSPGHVLRGRILERLFETREAERYDLMTGGGEHASYKLRWANDRREYVVLRLFNPGSVRGRLARRLQMLRRWMEGLRRPRVKR